MTDKSKKQQQQHDEGGPMPQISTQEFERLPRETLV
jgi:hypothetical protein